MGKSVIIHCGPLIMSQKMKLLATDTFGAKCMSSPSNMHVPEHLTSSVPLCFMYIITAG